MRWLLFPTLAPIAAALGQEHVSVEHSVAALSATAATVDERTSKEIGTACHFSLLNGRQQQEKECGANLAELEDSNAGDTSQEEGTEHFVDDVEVCMDLSDNCHNFGKSLCRSKFSKLEKLCPKHCMLCDIVNETHVSNLYGVPQRIQDADDTEDSEVTIQAFWQQLQQVDDYMYDVVYNDTDEALNLVFEPLREQCLNQHEACVIWAVQGECEANFWYMQMHCAPACLQCEYYTHREGCLFDWTTPRAWSKPGDLNAMFTRIVQENKDDDDSSSYTLTVLSQPDPHQNNNNNNTSTTRPVKGDKPWILQLDDFLNETECQVLQDLGAQQGYEGSKIANMSSPHAYHEGLISVNRTSTQAWCSPECQNHSVTRTILERIERLTHIPKTSYESFQLLKYEESQFYGQHSDYIIYQKDRHHGPRILTVFLYLNNVEEGGGTRFPLLDNLTVMPRMGRVVIWPSVLDQHPMAPDVRTEHDALPVLSGIKYAANAWVHQRDFQTPLMEGCMYD